MKTSESKTRDYSKTLQDKTLSQRKKIVDNRHIFSEQTNLVNVIQRATITAEAVKIDTSANIDATHLTVAYSSGCINCKEYSDNTKEITSSQFTGCIMAIFDCKKDIGGIKGGSKYAAHVANDDFIYYVVGRKRIQGYGKDLLKDLVNNGYISNLKYFRPCYRNFNEENLNRSSNHVDNLDTNHINEPGAESETGIIRFSEGEPTAFHKFDNLAPGEGNPDVPVDLTAYEGDHHHDILMGKSFYSDYHEVLFFAIKANNQNVIDNMRAKCADNATDVSNESLNCIALWNIDIGENNYTALGTERRRFYRNVLDNNPNKQVPSWLKSKHWIKYWRRQVIE